MTAESKGREEETMIMARIKPFLFAFGSRFLGQVDRYGRNGRRTSENFEGLSH